VVHFVVYGVVVLYPASFQDDVHVLSVFFLHGPVQGKACQFFFPCPARIGVFSCPVVQGRPDGPVSSFLVVACLGYVVGLFEAGVLFVQFVFPAQVPGPDPAFFSSQPDVSHPSRKVIVVPSPQEGGGGHGCFAPFHHLGFFVSIDDGGCSFSGCRCFHHPGGCCVCSCVGCCSCACRFRGMEGFPGHSQVSQGLLSCFFFLSFLYVSPVPSFAVADGSCFQHC